MPVAGCAFEPRRLQDFWISPGDQRGLTMRKGLQLSSLMLVAALLAGLSAMPAGAQDKKNPAATPSPRMGKGGTPDANWMKRHEGFVDIAKKGDVQVLFMGDSITDAWRQKPAAPTWMKYF